jgi:endonuclease YncB( thermonuclease family)
MFVRVRGQGSEKTSAGNIKYYVNKGIKVCGEWSDFRNFQRWAVANGYARDLVIDRVDGKGDYSPENCRWVSVAENNYNQERYKKNAIATRQRKKGS